MFWRCHPRAHPDDKITICVRPTIAPLLLASESGQPTGEKERTGGIAKGRLLDLVVNVLDEAARRRRRGSGRDCA